jgi:hypothetical protein
MRERDFIYLCFICRGREFWQKKRGDGGEEEWREKRELKKR